MMLHVPVAGLAPRWPPARAFLRHVRAEPDPVPGRAPLHICLGLVWLLDAALQYQPFMFGPFFVTQILQPATAGSPPIVVSSVTWATEVMLHHVALYNAAFATIQLAIAIGIFVPRTRKPALAVSICWAAAIWWFGESLGGIFAGASPLVGLPGGVLLYAVIAVLLWPSAGVRGRHAACPAASGPLGRSGADVVWVIIWGGFGYNLMLPANRSSAAISQIFAVTVGQPAWLTAIMDGFSGLARQRGLEISVTLAVLCACAAIGVLARRLVRPALVVAAALALLFWIAQGLGGIFTGQGTDPNSGLLLLLLAACYWPRSRSRSPDLPCPPSPGSGGPRSAPGAG